MRRWQRTCEKPLKRDVQRESDLVVGVGVGVVQVWFRCGGGGRLTVGQIRTDRVDGGCSCDAELSDLTSSTRCPDQRHA